MSSEKFMFKAAEGENGKLEDHFRMFGEGKRDLLFGLLIALVAFFTYANSLGNGFVWDDDVVIVNNPALTNTLFSLFSGIDTPQQNEVTPYYRPLTLLTFAMEQQWHGLTPFYVRLFNVLLHAVNSFLVYRLARTLFDNRSAAVLAALIFAVHPLNSEGVDFNAGGRNTMLACFFVLSAYLIHRRSIMSEKISCALAGSFLFFLGLFSKETAVAGLPFIGSLEVAVFHAEARQHRGRTIVRILPYAVCVIVYLILRNNALSSFGVHIEIFPGLGSRLLSNMYIFPKYLLSVIWPVALSPKYFIPENLHAYALPLVLAWICIFIGLWWCFTHGRSHATFFGLAWFTVFWLPVSGIIPIPSAPFADRYLYVPAIGLWIVVADQAFRLKWFRDENKYYVLYAAGVLLLLLSSVTVRRNMDWRSDIALFSRYVEQYPDSAFAHHNLGCAYLDKVKNLDLAESEFEKALALDPFFPKLRTQMGYVRLLRGDYDGAIHDYNEAVSQVPFDAEALLNRAIALDRLGKHTDALIDYRRFLATPGSELPLARPGAERRIQELSR